MLSARNQEIETRLLYYVLLSDTVILFQMVAIGIIELSKPLTVLSLSDRCKAIQKQLPDHKTALTCVYSESERLTGQVTNCYSIFTSTYTCSIC